MEIDEEGGLEGTCYTEWLTSSSEQCRPFVYKALSHSTAATAPAVTHAPTTHFNTGPPPTLALETVCGDLDGSKFKRLKGLFGIQKGLKNQWQFQDLFFNRSRTPLDDQNSDEIIKFVKHMDSRRNFPISRTRRATRKTSKSRNHSRLNQRATIKEANHGSNRAHSSRGKEGKNRKRLTKEIHKINSPRTQSHEFWPWHIHIRSYKSDIPIECSGMLLERILNYLRTLTDHLITLKIVFRIRFRSEVDFIYLTLVIVLVQNHI